MVKNKTEADKGKRGEYAPANVHLSPLNTKGIQTTSLDYTPYFYKAKVKCGESILSLYLSLYFVFILVLEKTQ